MRKLSNRCPVCASMSDHYLTTIHDEVLYLANCPHDLIIDQHGRVFTDTVAYNSGNKVHTAIITDGKVKA